MLGLLPATPILDKERVTPRLDTYPLRKDVDTFGRVDVLEPGGFYKVELHPSFMSFMDIQGPELSFQIAYSDVASLHVLHKEMRFFSHKREPKIFVVMTLKSPITIGLVADSHIVVQFELGGLSLSTLSLNEDCVTVDRESFDQGTEWKFFAQSLTSRSGVRITFNGKFRSHDKDYTVSAALGVNLGYLYPLEDSLLFIGNPSRHIVYEEICSVEFVQLFGSSDIFHLLVRKTNGEKFLFKYIDCDEHVGLYNFLESHGLNVSKIDLERVDNVRPYLCDDSEEDEVQYEYEEEDLDELDQFSSEEFLSDEEMFEYRHEGC